MTKTGIDLREELRAAMLSVQDGWRTEDADSPELMWSMLTLESVTVEDGVAIFVMRDPDGGRHGWRWDVYDGPELPLGSWLYVHLMEDLAETERPTDSDDNGVQWWGVHRLPNGPVDD
jgi:hypothetical protein